MYLPKMVFSLFFILLFSENFRTFSSAQLQATISPPLIYNAYQDSTELGSFTCITTNSDDIRWIVDAYAHNHPSLRDEIFVYTESYANRSQHSVIRIPAIPANNHIAEIECRAYSDEPWEVAYSAQTTQFSIQGLLEPPNATYSSYNATHYLVEWMQPQSLDISNVEPDIENYTTCIYKNNIESMPECANTTTIRLFLPKYFFDQFVYITVWNIVGQSVCSGQLVIETCNSTQFSMAGSERPLSLADMEFDNDNNTVFKISFTEYDNKSNVTMINDCLYLYEVTVTQRRSMEVLTAVQQYGYDHSIVLNLPLPKDELYTLNIVRTTHSKQLLLNPINFSTYDLQDVRVSKEGNLLKVTCHFARGATARRCMLVLESDNGTISLERSLSLSNDTACRTSTTQCSVHTIFDLSALIIVGNVSLIVSGFEASVLNNVHVREFRIELSDFRTEVMNSTSSNNTTKIRLTTPGNSTDTGVMVVIILSAGVVGGAIGAVCLVGISIVTIRVVLRRLSSKRCTGKIYDDNQHPRLHPNEAYSLVLQLRRNEAYETTGKPPVSQEDTDPHLYDEITLPAQNKQTKEPVYAEIGGSNQT